MLKDERTLFMSVNGTDMSLEVFSAMKTLATPLDRTDIQSSVVLIQVRVSGDLRRNSSATTLLC